MKEPQTVSIEYMPITEMDRMIYPDVAYEVICPGEWSDEEIADWYEKRHHHIRHKGIKVLKINH